jgi:hypothetical protein
MGAVKPNVYNNTLLLQQQMMQVTFPPAPCHLSCTFHVFAHITCLPHASPGDCTTAANGRANGRHASALPLLWRAGAAAVRARMHRQRHTCTFMYHQRHTCSHMYRQQHTSLTPAQLPNAWNRPPARAGSHVHVSPLLPHVYTFTLIASCIPPPSLQPLRAHAHAS